MNGEVIIRKAEGLGARMWVEGAKLELDLPDDFPHSVLEEIRANKAAVMATLVLPIGAGALMDWAVWLAESAPASLLSVSFDEVPLRPVTVKLADVGRYASRIVGDLAAMASGEACNVPDLRPGWRRDRIEELCGRLSALREALRPLDLAEIKDGFE